MTFFSRLTHRIQDIDSFLCIGLDPHRQDLPEFSGNALKDFCLKLIEQTVDFAAGYKPNIAFFEACGPDGISALIEIISAIPDEVPVILDAKRGDISSTAEAYAEAVFRVYGADAVTINPYLGYDSIEPFIRDSESGIFLLCKTSNPGARDLQDLPVKSEDLNNEFIPLYKHVATLANSWNHQDNVGIVVGATQPDSLRKIREAAPDLWILAPGVGAQGGDIQAALQAGLRQDGLGMLIPVSRSISRSGNPRKSASDIRDSINLKRKDIRLRQPKIELGEKPWALSSIADGLLDAGCIKFGNFTLKSGIQSPFYFDLRRLVAYPELLKNIAQSYIQILKRLNFEHLAGLPYAALPITSAISYITNWTMVYPRKEVKEYGTAAQIEGVFEEGDVVVVIDDLISTGGSKFEAIAKLESGGLVVNDVVVLIDRSKDGKDEISIKGFNLHAVIHLSEILDYYENKGKVSVERLSAARNFIEIR